MKKKILVISFIAVFMLISISLVSAINANNSEETKESPLFRIRAENAIGQKIERIFEQIKSKFLGERIFFIPFLSNDIIPSWRYFLYQKEFTDQFQCTLMQSGPTCFPNYNTCYSNCFTTDATCDGGMNCPK